MIILGETPTIFRDFQRTSEGFRDTGQSLGFQIGGKQFGKIPAVVLVIIMDVIEEVGQPLFGIDTGGLATGPLFRTDVQITEINAQLVRIHIPALFR